MAWLTATARQAWRRFSRRGNEHDPARRAGLSAARDRERTDAIVAADRFKYVGRIGGSSIEDELGRDPERNAHRS